MTNRSSTLIKVTKENETRTFMVRLCEDGESPTDGFLYIGAISGVLGTLSIISSLWLYHQGNYRNMLKWSKIVCCLRPIIHLTTLVEDNGYEVAGKIFASKLKIGKSMLTTKDRLFGSTPINRQYFRNKPVQKPQTKTVFEVQPLSYCIRRGHLLLTLLLSSLGANWTAVDQSGTADDELAKYVEENFEAVNERFFLRRIFKAQSLKLFATAASDGHAKTCQYFKSKSWNQQEHYYLVSAFGAKLAIVASNPDYFEMLIQNKAFVQARSDHSDRVIHLAAKHGYSKSLKVLLESKFDINAANFFGQTPLHFAAENRHFECLDLLLKNKANVNARNQKQETALHSATRNSDFASMKLLIEVGAEVNAHTKIDGDTPLHLAVDNGDMNCLTLLIDSKAEISATNKSRHSAIHRAADIGNIECLKFLIQKGADVNSRKSLRETAAHLAAKNGHVECLKLLLENQADINARNSFKETPLHYAAEFYQVDTLKLLIENEAEMSVPNREGRTALHLAALKPMEDFLNRRRAPKPTTDKSAPPMDYPNKVECLKILTEHGADLEVLDKYHRTAMYCVEKELRNMDLGLLEKSLTSDSFEFLMRFKELQPNLKCDDNSERPNQDNQN